MVKIKIGQHPKKSPTAGMSVIIFSKDRPLQLEALIESYFYYVKNALPLKIIYNAKDEKFENAYKRLFERYNKKISHVFNDKHGFKIVLTEALNKIETEKMFFLVDDIVFKNPIDLSVFHNIKSDSIPSLRLAPHLTRNYTQGKNQPLPHFKTEQSLFYWKYGDASLDWGYPLSVDGHIFSTWEIIEATKAITFKAPNSYESKLQKFNPVFKKRWGVCLNQSTLLNIPCNKVQTENDNIAGNISPNELLDIFYEQKIDFLKYKEFINESCHQELPLYFTGRKLPFEGMN